MRVADHRVLTPRIYLMNECRYLRDITAACSDQQVEQRTVPCNAVAGSGVTWDCTVGGACVLGSQRGCTSLQAAIIASAVTKGSLNGGRCMHAWSIGFALQLL
jgi:hypothetical protein